MRHLRFGLLLMPLVTACDGGGGNADDDADVAADIEDAADEGDIPAEALPPSTFEGEVRIEGGGAWMLHVAPTGLLTGTPVPDPLDALSDTGRSAVEAAPDWVREDLARTLSQLEAADADLYAAEILAADALTIDETAWAIAVTSPGLLVWMADNAAQQAFRANAEAIYAMDGRVAYARLVERPDGRTTLELDGEGGTAELDPEFYLWNVVYPRAYFELPLYDRGVFWRSLFPDDTRHGAKLIDAVAGATTVREAVQAVGEWIQGFMSFTYETNFLQPIEIYRDPRGSCGEYSILTSAAAKTVLLPTVSVSARADDHEWNEFWDGRWIQWDNSLGEIGTNPHYPYIDWPEIYDDDLYDGAGVFGELAHVLRFRADENIAASEQYTPMQAVTITVRDADGTPVEGARVIARSNESGYIPCTWSYTDPEGLASFLLGDDLIYGFTTDHPILGELPETGVLPRIATVQDGDPLAEEIAYPDAYPRRLVDGGAPPEGERSLRLSFTVLRTDQRRVNVITEDYDLDLTHRASLEGGRLDVFLVDAAGRDAFLAGSAFTAYSTFAALEEGTAELTLPADRDWYVVLDDAWWPNEAKLVTVTATASR
jgi:hypothetical protein